MTKAHRLLWTGPALEDLRPIQDYISRDKPEAARRLAGNIRKSVLRLARFPHSGRGLPEFPDTGLREVVVAPYRIVYELRGRDVLILRVWHGRRQVG